MAEIVVVGSINLDLVTLVERLPAPGETVKGRSGGQVLGGKGANQAVAGLLAGAPTRLVGAVGSDAMAGDLIAALEGFGLSTDGIERVAGASGYAQILVSREDNQIAVVAGANALVDVDRVSALAMGPGDVCMAQLETTPAVVMAAFRQARALGATTLINTAPADGEDLDGIIALSDVVVANETEWALISGAPFDAADPGRALTAVAAMSLFAGKLLVATLGGAGVCALSNGDVISLAAHRVEVTDTTGAGDCFCGYLAAGLAAGETLAAALTVANGAAALAVQKPGASVSVPTRAEVAAFLG